MGEIAGWVATSIYVTYVSDLGDKFSQYDIAGLEAEYFNKTAIGFWRYSAKFDDVDGWDDKHNSQGAYLITEPILFQETGHPSQGLSSFVRMGVASDKVNEVSWAGNAGLSCYGLIIQSETSLLKMLGLMVLWWSLSFKTCFIFWPLHEINPPAMI